VTDSPPRALAAALADRYRLERELGAGGMATVYLAEDVKHRRRVAVKVFRPDLAAVLGVERFLREIETTANLRHPHILPLYDSGEADGFLFYVMPLVEGESLRGALTRVRRLPVEDAFRIAGEVADGLSYAHERGVIHRDIKPENILLESGHAVVADFGIAKAVSTLDGNQLTQTGLAVGTPAYMSPEQALADASLDGRSDLYGLGCVLYEMLVGEPPFAGGSPQRTIARRLTEPPPDVAAIRPEVGAALGAAVQQLLAVDPADRPTTAAAFVALLAQISQTGTSASSARSGAVSATASDSSVAIAVLPFADMSPAKDQEYLCEGMAEEIMNALVKVDGLRVASRTSTFRARQDNAGLPAIARALSINHALEGSIRTAGIRFRVTAQLTDVASGYQLWSERFDREATDIFAVQDEIATGVVDAVRARLAPGAHAVPARPHVGNLEAYRSYLRGRHLRYAKEDYGGAIRAFEEAIALDATHAPSWTALAETLALAASYGGIRVHEACATARKALAKAVELEGETADSQHGEGWLALLERRWPAMEVAWRRAIDLHPTHALALGSFGISLCICRKFDEGFQFLERAREVDPLSSFPYMLTGLGWLNAGNAEQALRYTEDALTFEPDDASALINCSIAQVALGRFDDGIATAERVVAVTHRAPAFVGELGWALAMAGRIAEAKLLLAELRARPADAPTLVAEAWLLGALGEVDAAFAVLERAERECQLFLYFHGLPTFDSLRADPRFPALIDRLGLAGEEKSLR